jgi:hypothetical protein
MNKTLLLFSIVTLLTSSVLASELRTFSNAEGETLEDRILKFDYQERVVTLEKNGKVKLDTFSDADQAYILHWNQVEGFKSTMRFKIEIDKSNWARMKHEQTITPYFMDSIQIPGKKTPNHHIIIVDDYEEYNAVYLEAEGYAITIRNQNFFPIENLVVESKIYYEQEEYVITDSLFVSSENEYYDTVTTNKVRFLSETVPIIIPREEVVMNSESAIIVDHQVERNALITESEDEGDEDDEGSEETDSTIEGFGDWDDHGRRRKGKVTGAWFRIGIKDTDGKMVWREITSPTSLPGKFSWDPEAEDTDSEE